MKNLLKVWMFISFFSFLGCSNILTNGAKKDSDEAIFEEIQKSVNDSDWTTALSQFETLSDSFKTRTEVIEAWAGAYAGKCGLNFLEYVENIGNDSLTGTTVFKYLMNGFTSTTVSPADCDLAQSKMEEISVNASERTTDENYFMAVLGMVKIGTYLRSLADTDQDGATDGTFDSCSTASISDANLNNLITGVGLISSNIAYADTSEVTTSLATLTAQCSLAGANCSATDPNDVVAVDRDFFRDLLKTGSGNPTAPAGIESCVDPLLTPCCP